MAMCRLVFPILVLTVVQSYASTQVPVFLWGDLPKTPLKSNPLSKVTVPEFDEILKEELQDDPFTVIFIEETLSVEDLSRKSADGESSYPYLHANIGDSLYLPSVEHALRALNKLADPDKVDHVKLTENGLSAEIEPESGKFLFINLNDAREGESRLDLLRRHNDFMEDMFTKLQERYDRVVAVYTAHYPSWTIPETHSRVRRQAQASSNLYPLDGLLLYVNSLVLNDGSNDINLTGLSGNLTVYNNTEMDTTLVFDGDNNVTLNFVSSRGYWYFRSVTVNRGNPAVEEHLQANSEVYAILGFSYRCAQTVSFASVNDTRQYRLTFHDLKVQPFFETGNSSELAFGDSFNCVGFFSVPIWSGLFVTFVMLAITFYGIMMMLDIRTNDRFDDPKGKTITINTSE